jgi:hypothetical protein
MMDLSARSGFNAAGRHIKKALGILEALEGGENFANILRRPPCDGLSPAASLSLLNLLLVDKLGYTALSANPPGYAPDIPALAGEFRRWEAVDMVAVFHASPFPRIVNPKDAGQLAALGRPFPRELLVVYAGSVAGSVAGGVAGEKAAEAARAALALFSGETVPGTIAEFGALAERTTPLYSVPVTNDLFHNGNVEAWKRVIGDYERSRPGLKVQVYYEGEPVLNLNALFAWGKVKHGGLMQFSVSSAEGAVPGTARLRRLLAQAASRDFEPLLGGPEGAVP